MRPARDDRAEYRAMRKRRARIRARDDDRITRAHMVPRY